MRPSDFRVEGHRVVSVRLVDVDRGQDNPRTPRRDLDVFLRLAHLGHGARLLEPGETPLVGEVADAAGNVLSGVEVRAESGLGP